MSDLEKYAYSSSKSRMPTPSRPSLPPSTVSPLATFNRIIAWRKENQAPVDILGCERLWQKQQSRDVQKYQILISLMLSVQTKDGVTADAVRKLQQYGLNPKQISLIPESELISMIYSCNYNKVKAKNIIAVSKIIVEKGLPSGQTELLALPGVGVKIAMLYLRVAEGKSCGIGVDTHVHRISNRLKWVTTQTPNATEEKLKCVFPESSWGDLNATLVGFGQLMCKAKKPDCMKCPVNDVCDSRDKLSF